MCPRRPCWVVTRNRGVVAATQGVVAKNKDLMKAFKTTDHLECCKFILTKGDVQISEGERQVAYDRCDGGSCGLCCAGTYCTALQHVPRCGEHHRWHVCESVLEPAVHRTLHVACIHSLCVCQH